MLGPGYKSKAWVLLVVLLATETASKDVTKTASANQTENAAKCRKSYNLKYKLEAVEYTEK